jgi:hypothetical protein
MIIRAFAGMALGGALSLGALYAASEYLGLKPAQYAMGALVEETARDTGDSMEESPDAPSDSPHGEVAEQDLEGEPPIALPYEEGERAAAAWLFEVLTGTGPYEAYVRGDFTQSADLADWAARASWPQPVRPGNPQRGDQWEVYTADCQPSHVALFCGVHYSNTNWESAGFEGALEAFENNASYTFLMEQDENGAWHVDPDSVAAAFQS